MMRRLLQVSTVLLIFLPAIHAFPVPDTPDGKSMEALLAEAGLAFKENRNSIALDLYQKVLQQDPTHIQAQQMSGYIYYKAKYFDEARMAFQKVIETHGESFTPLFHLGNVYLSLSMPMKALEYYEKARALNPGDAVLAGNIELARESIERAQLLASRYSRSTQALWWGAGLGCLVLVLVVRIEMRVARAKN